MRVILQFLCPLPFAKVSMNRYRGHKEWMISISTVPLMYHFNDTTHSLTPFFALTAVSSLPFALFQSVWLGFFITHILQQRQQNPSYLSHRWRLPTRHSRPHWSL